MCVYLCAISTFSLGSSFCARTCMLVRVLEGWDVFFSFSLPFLFVCLFVLFLLLFFFFFLFLFNTLQQSRIRPWIASVGEHALRALGEISPARRRTQSLALLQTPRPAVQSLQPLTERTDEETYIPRNRKQGCASRKTTAVPATNLSSMPASDESPFFNASQRRVFLQCQASDESFFNAS